jgi:hypothetical protein
VNNWRGSPSPRPAGVFAIAVSSLDAVSAEMPRRRRPNPIDVFWIGAGSQTSGEGTDKPSSTRGDMGMVKPTGMTPTIVYFSPS